MGRMGRCSEALTPIGDRGGGYITDFADNRSHVLATLAVLRVIGVINLGTKKLDIQAGAGKVQLYKQDGIWTK